MKNASEKFDDGKMTVLEKQWLDAVDRRILAIIQSGFPLSPHPYAVIGSEVGLTEAEALAHVRALKKQGLIRRIGANFQSSKLGFRSTLCSACVPNDKLDEFVAEVNKHTEVTHNYLRNHHYNVWFTCIASSWEAVCSLLSGITRETGISINNLPATRLYKIKVDFPMN